MINKFTYGETIIEWYFEEDKNLKHHYITVEKNKPVVLKGEVISFEEQQSFVKNKVKWIKKKYQQFSQISDEEIVTGSRIKYRGRYYFTQIMKQENTSQIKVEFNHSRFIIITPSNLENHQIEIKKELKEFFKAKSVEKLRPRIKYWEKLTGLKSSGFKLHKFSRRWASCTSSNVLEFNFKCMELSPKMMDYIIVHELVHTLHHDHSKKFWLQVGKIMPNWNVLHKSLEWEL